MENYGWIAKGPTFDKFSVYTLFCTSYLNELSHWLPKKTTSVDVVVSLTIGALSDITKR